MAATYYVLMLGDVASRARASLETSVATMARDFGLTSGDEIDFVDDADGLPVATATVAVYFGSAKNSESDVYTRLLKQGVPILPVISTLTRASEELPRSLRVLNALALDGSDALNAAAAAVLECLSLLPRQRRVFISYIRVEATAPALQLFAELERRQFSVFVDTHGVRYADNFQEELWHNLNDCDVMVMLDTSKYFQSQWTQAEFARANMKKASILRVAFPGIVRDDNLSITDDLALTAADIGVNGELTPDALDRVCDRIERLRSKSIATRTAAMIGSVRSAVSDMKGSVSAMGAMRRIEVTLPSGKTVLVYPAIGVPTAALLNEVADNAEKKLAAIVYDKFGVRERWLRHLEWLGLHVPQVRWIESWNAFPALSAWDAEQ
jgi:hypothetical protein